MKPTQWIGAFMGFCMVIGGVYACATSQSIGRVHPFEVPSPPVCSVCHSDERAALDHNSDFELRHRFYAVQQIRTCSLCHRGSFCSDCHANKEEIKASDKYKAFPRRFMPHRGDYLTQHKIDGRINPTSCLKCHGRNNNARCKECHRT